MICTSCGKNVAYPRMSNDSQHGFGWGCSCGWFNKSKKQRREKSCQAPRRKGCLVCGSTDLRSFFSTYQYVECLKCEFIWEVDGAGRPVR